MRATTALAATLALVAASPAAGATGPRACPALARAPAAVLKIDYGTIVYHTDRDAAELEQLRHTRGMAARPPGQVAAGLTLTEMEFRMHTRVAATPLGRGRYCASLGSVEATVGHPTFRVYIASRYPPGSCPYGVVMRHENSHVAAFRAALVRLAPKFRERLSEAVRRLEPVVVAEPDQAAALLQERLRRDLAPVLAELSRAEDAENARLDSPESYRREQEKCADW
ncbi:MAG: hypothetical protein HY521_13415 [Proteobacteria bacterium]|nr:hypothetical protein [Pseudomonadota bacterium]